ncbi:hypothetical protein BH23PLA1_BH23PLA1_01130 [soil metagenome]
MPKLRRGDDGAGYSTKVLHDDETVLYQITPEGVEYLKDRGCEEGGTFDLSDLYHLIDQGWAQTEARAPGGTGPAKLPKAPAGSDRGEPAIADAAALFQNEAPAPPQDPPKASGGPAVEQARDHEGGYELLGGAPALSDDEPIAPVPSRPAPPVTIEEEEVEEESRPARSRKLDSYVDQTWSRGAEWGLDLLRLAFVALVTLGLAYFVGSAAGSGLGFLVLVLGGGVLVALSYPIVITLERPTRMTPEQAVRDYFGALSHHFPHYRRMWLLLSTPGRSAPEYQSFSEFRAYWKRRLAELRGSQGSSLTPLNFRVESFKADKSAGREDVEASYSIEVELRGQTGEEPLFSRRLKTSLVRGPDRMWYLDDGRLDA